MKMQNGFFSFVYCCFFAFGFVFMFGCSKHAPKNDKQEKTYFKDEHDKLEKGTDKKLDTKGTFESILKEVKQKKSKKITVATGSTVAGRGAKYKKLISAEMPAAKIRPDELDFEAYNDTGKAIYVTCFSYIKKRMFAPWRWDKSNVYKLEDKQHTIIDIDTIEDRETRDSVYAYLAIFDNQKDAQESTYEKLPDQNKLDLDSLSDLKNRRVNIYVEKYGLTGDYLDYKLADQKTTSKKKALELDVAVENKTGKTILVVCFVYQKKAKGKWLKNLDELDDMQVWRFDKTPIIKVPDGEIGVIDIDTITDARDRENVRGILGIFDEDEAKEAVASTYELLESYKKIILAESLVRLIGKKVVISVEKYGFDNDFIDFIVKPAQRIDLKKVYEKN